MVDDKPAKNFYLAFALFFISGFFFNEMLKDDVFNFTKHHQHWKAVAFEIFGFIVCASGAFLKLKQGICLMLKRNQKPL